MGPQVQPKCEKQLRIEKTRLSHQVWSHGGSTPIYVFHSKMELASTRKVVAKRAAWSAWWKTNTNTNLSHLHCISYFRNVLYWNIFKNTLQIQIHMQMLKQMQIQMQLRMRIQIQVVKLWQSLEKTAAFASRSALLENSKVVQFSASSPQSKCKDKYENKYNCKTI